MTVKECSYNVQWNILIWSPANSLLGNEALHLGHWYLLPLLPCTLSVCFNKLFFHGMNLCKHHTCMGIFLTLPLDWTSITLQYASYMFGMFWTPLNRTCILMAFLLHHNGVLLIQVNMKISSCKCHIYVPSYNAYRTHFVNGTLHHNLLLCTLPVVYHLCVLFEHGFLNCTLMHTHYTHHKHTASVFRYMSVQFFMMKFNPVCRLHE